MTEIKKEQKMKDLRSNIKSIVTLHWGDSLIRLVNELCKCVKKEKENSFINGLGYAQNQVYQYSQKISSLEVLDEVENYLNGIEVYGDDHFEYTRGVVKIVDKARKHVQGLRNKHFPLPVQSIKTGDPFIDEIFDGVETEKVKKEIVDKPDLKKRKVKCGCCYCKAVRKEKKEYEESYKERTEELKANLEMFKKVMGIKVK